MFSFKTSQDDEPSNSFFSKSTFLDLPIFPFKVYDIQVKKSRGLEIHVKQFLNKVRSIFISICKSATKMNTTSMLIGMSNSYKWYTDTAGVKKCHV